MPTSPARAFACVVHKASYPNRGPIEIAFEDLCNRFDRYLYRLCASGDTQWGLVILDKSSHETRFSVATNGKFTVATNTLWSAILLAFTLGT